MPIPLEVTVDVEWTSVVGHAETRSDTEVALTDAEIVLRMLESVELVEVGGRAVALIDE